MIQKKFIILVNLGHIRLQIRKLLRQVIVTECVSLEFLIWLAKSLRNSIFV